MRNFTIKDKKCGTCEFCAVDRNIKNGMLGKSLETKKDKGVCTKRNNNSQVSVGMSPCPKYKRWATIEAELMKIKQLKEDKKKEQQEHNQQIRQNELEKRTNEEILRNQRELERENRRLKNHIEKQEYEQWYNSLTEEEKKLEDDKVTEELKIQEIELQEYEEYSKRAHNDKIRSNLKSIVVNFFLLGFSASVFLGVAGIYHFSTSRDVANALLELEKNPSNVNRDIYDTALFAQSISGIILFLVVTAIILPLIVLIVKFIYYKKQYRY